MGADGGGGGVGACIREVLSHTGLTRLRAFSLRRCFSPCFPAEEGGRETGAGVTRLVPNIGPPVILRAAERRTGKLLTCRPGAKMKITITASRAARQGETPTSCGSVGSCVQLAVGLGHRLTHKEVVTMSRMGPLFCARSVAKRWEVNGRPPRAHAGSLMLARKARERRSPQVCRASRGGSGR